MEWETESEPEDVKRPLQVLREFWAGMEAETQGRDLGQILQDLRTKAKEVGDEMMLGFVFFKTDWIWGCAGSSWLHGLSSKCAAWSQAVLWVWWAGFPLGASSYCAALALGPAGFWSCGSGAQ